MKTLWRWQAIQLARKAIWIRITRYGLGCNFDCREAGAIYQAGNIWAHHGLRFNRAWGRVV